MELLHARRNRSVGTFTTSLCSCYRKLCATRRASDAGEHFFEEADVALHHGAVHRQTRCPARGSSSRTPRRCNVSLRRPRPPSWLGRHHRRLPGHFCRSGGPHTEAAASDVAVWMRPTVDMPEILATANSNCLSHRYLGNRCTSKEQRTILRKVRFAAVPATRVLAHPAADDSRGWRYGELCNRGSNAMLALL